MIEEKAKEIREERGKVYGDVRVSHESIGLIWQGILSNYYQKELDPIPPHIVALMMSGLKISRASAPLGYQEDDFVDLMNYAGFGAELDPQRVK